MVSKIEDLTNLLREIRQDFQAAIIIAEEDRKKELEALKKGYIPNSEPYEQKKKQIELDYDMKVVQARANAADTAREAFEDLREWEIQKVQRIDTEALAKINAIRDIPVTANELKLVLKKFPTSNYWVQKNIAAIAEQNGIPQADLEIDASLDVKLNTLDGLSNQLEKMLENFTLDEHKCSYDQEAIHSRWLYLNDDVLGHAIDIYNNNMRDISEMDAATRAFYKVKGTSGQVQKGVVLSGILRNLKEGDARDSFLCRLSQEQDISSTAYEVAGISSEMAEWQHGKSERYIKAIKMADELKTVNDTEKIKSKLRTYLDRVGKGLEQENEFLSKALVTTCKRNSSIGKALEEMDRTERNTLLRNNAETERYAKAE